MPHRIRLRKITQSFGEVVVLDGLDLDVAEGEFIVLLGRSGSGKSTLLRLIAGLDKATAGQAHVDGKVAFAFQEARLFPWWRVHRNVLFGHPVPGTRGERREAALTALREVNLGHRADAWPVTLSGGEAQRAALARALIREPQVLLLDEPFGALDALTRLEMQRLVIDLWQRHRPSVVMVTHDVGEAVRLADRVLLLENGHFVEEVRIDAPRPRHLDDTVLTRLERDLTRRLGVEF
ncbi:MAG: ABC transporter ATP-binding protein [Xenophilus sp.]